MGRADDWQDQKAKGEDDDILPSSKPPPAIGQEEGVRRRWLLGIAYLLAMGVCATSIVAPAAELR